ncbi:hypothetical protein CapIbe_011116, partial [Capra ibex]
TDSGDPETEAAYALRLLQPPPNQGRKKPAALREERQAEKVREERAVSWTRPQHGLASFPRFPQPGAFSSRSRRWEKLLPPTKLRFLRLAICVSLQPASTSPRGEPCLHVNPEGPELCPLKAEVHGAIADTWANALSSSGTSASSPTAAPATAGILALGRGLVCGLRAALCHGAFHGSSFPRVQSTRNRESCRVVAIFLNKRKNNRNEMKRQLSPWCAPHRPASPPSLRRSLWEGVDVTPEPVVHSFPTRVRASTDSSRGWVAPS